MAIKFKDRLAMQPAGGWHFIENGTTFQGDTPEEVISKVSDYRVRNGIAQGDPRADLLHFVATRWPNLVTIDDGPPVTVVENPIYEHGWNWLVSLTHYTNPGDVPFQQAEEQKRICSECPLNIPYPKGDDVLKTDFERRSFLMRKGRSSDLGFCFHHRWDNRVAVFRNRNAINAQPDSPPFCWMNQDLASLKLDGPELRIGKSSSEV
jgi:hypothetical protein